MHIKRMVFFDLDLRAISSIPIAQDKARIKDRDKDKT